MHLITERESIHDIMEALIKIQNGMTIRRRNEIFAPTGKSLFAERFDHSLLN